MVSPICAWFDGRQALAVPVHLRVQADELWLCAPQGGEALRRYALAGLLWPEALMPLRQLDLPDGGQIECQQAEAWDAWVQQAALPASRLAAWARSPLHQALLALLTLLVLAAGMRWGVPATADAAAHWVSPAWEEQLGDALMKQIDEEAWVEPSRLSEFQREQALAAMAPVMRQLEREGRRVNLLFRAGSAQLGPNAFALPGGTVVFTDALVRELPGDAALAGVLGHEMGHVRHRHGLRHVFRYASYSALASLWLGDTSWLLAVAPAALLQAGHSRDAEREADQEALRLMRAAQIDPRVMVRLFAALKARRGDEPDRTEGLGLASHPADDERIRFFGR